MKSKYILAIGLIVATSLSGCKKVLDKTDPTAVSAEQTWSNPLLATAFLDKCYSDALPDWDDLFSAYSDETRQGDSFLYGQLTSEGGDGPTADIISDRYASLYKINTLLINIDGGSLEEAKRNLIKGQALFLRAYIYFDLVKRYGGMPLILAPQKREESLVPRNKTSECIAQIVKDLDAAAGYLPGNWASPDYGRITRGAALALKGRMLMFYASKQFNRSNDPARWKTAYDANLAAKNQLTTDGYQLNAKFADTWANETSKETVLTSRFAYPARTSKFQAGLRPLEYSQGASGGHQPSLDMVLAFPMADGSTPGVVVGGIKKNFNPEATDQTGLFWLNRDPRFYQTIVTNGMLYELNGNTWPEKRQFTYQGGELGGANPTATGFYSRKFVQPQWDKLEASNCGLDWIEIRYAEVLLNLAECASELGGKDAEVYQILKDIRKRAGITPNADDLYGLKASMTPKELTDAVLFEKRIELAYEGKRFWDLRRRMLFNEPEFVNYQRKMVVVNRTNAYKTMTREDLIPLICQGGGDAKMNSTQYFNYFVTVVKLIDDKFKWSVKDNYYFFPLPKKHFEQNNLLEQTKGWNDGTFDPLLYDHEETNYNNILTFIWSLIS